MIQDVEAKNLKNLFESVLWMLYNQENVVEICAHTLLFFSSILSQEENEWFVSVIIWSKSVFAHPLQFFSSILSQKDHEWEMGLSPYEANQCLY